ncbi:unnamed protein product, partial [Phaeothamnion confervicola]
LLIVACLFNVLDPVLTVAAALAHKSPFVTPFGDSARSAAEASRQRFAQHKSDHLAIVEAFNAWRNRKTGNGGGGVGDGELWEWCRENFLSFSVLDTMEQLR